MNRARACAVVLVGALTVPATAGALYLYGFDVGAAYIFGR